MEAKRKRLSLEHWKNSWNKWCYNITGEGSDDNDCGYCQDAVSCDDCILDKRICDDADSYYDEWCDTPEGSDEELKYSLLILEAVVVDGRKWGYMGKKREAIYAELLEKYKIKEKQ